MEENKYRDILLDMLMDCAICRLFGRDYKEQAHKPNTFLLPNDCEITDIELVDVPISYNYSLVFNTKTKKYDIASFLRSPIKKNGKNECFLFRNADFLNTEEVLSVLSASFDIDLIGKLVVMAKERFKVYKYLDKLVSNVTYYSGGLAFYSLSADQTMFMTHKRTIITFFYRIFSQTEEIDKSLISQTINEREKWIIKEYRKRIKLNVFK